MTEIDDLARDWARYPQFWEPKVSRDGSWVAWTWTGVTEIGNVWLAPTDGSLPPRRLTDEPDHTYVRAFFRDGGRMLLGQSQGASEHDHLILLDHRSGERRLVTPPQDNHYVFGGAFTPDGRYILYTASHDDESRSPIDGQRIYLHDLETGNRKIVSSSKSLTTRPLALSEDGRLVLYHRCERHPAGDQIWLLDLATGEDREILNVGASRKAHGFWLDRERILVRAESDTCDRVGILHRADLRVQWLIDDPKRSIENVIAGHDGNTIAIVDFRGGQVRASLLDARTATERPIESAGQSVLPIAELPGGAWIAERYSSAGPHALIQYDPASAKMLDLSRTSEYLPSRKMNFTRATIWRWQSVDGMEIRGSLYEPKGPSRGLIAHIHGGPTWHTQDWVDSMNHFLVAAGYTILDPNYRGSTGHGRLFREAIKVDGWGGREQVDIRTGLESLVRAGKARIGRIGIVGLSYGGYSSWYQITKSADLVVAAVPICGMYHLTIDYDETGMPHGRAYSEEMMGGTPAQQPQRYFEASPANFIDRIKGRLLIVHGFRDTNVSPENTSAACRDLDRAGIAYELLTFADEGHGIHRAGNRETLFRRMATFFEEAFGEP